MLYEEFLELNKEYRLVCEFIDDKPLKDNVIMPVYGNKGFAYWRDDNRVGLIMFVSPSSIAKKVKDELGITIEYDKSGDNSGEFSLFLDDETFFKILSYLKPKKQSAIRRVPPHSIRNLTYFNRVFRHIHERYSIKDKE